MMNCMVLCCMLVLHRCYLLYVGLSPLICYLLCGTGMFGKAGDVRKSCLMCGEYFRHLHYEETV